MTVSPECVWALGAHLGEGPVWSTTHKCLWFVDIKQRLIHQYEPGKTGGSTFAMPEQPGFALPASGGDLVIGLPGRLMRFNPRTESLATLESLHSEPVGNRLNDAFVDGTGRLWFGSMDDQEEKPTGVLYSWRNSHLVKHDEGICITNGPATSPDGRTLYHTDTLAREVYAFDLAEDGSTSRKRLFLKFDSEFGWPDGTCVDSTGCLWIAFFAGWAVRCYAPDGRLVATIRMPCANVTKVAFGGSDLRTVFVTTATKGLNAQQLQEQPLAGGLFTFQSPVPGIATPEIAFTHD